MRGETHAGHRFVLKHRKFARVTDLFSSIGKLVRGVESFSNVESSLSKGKRNREVESVQFLLKYMERILSDVRRSLHEFLETETHRVFQREFVAQTRVSEAQSELDRRAWERRNADIALCETELAVCTI